MPKPLMDISAFNARYHAGRINSGGPRYQRLVSLLTKHQTTMTSGGKNYRSVSNNLNKIIYLCGEILTASKQPSRSSKRTVVEELATQAANENKYMGRRMHLGLAINHDVQLVKQIHSDGVGKNYKAGLNRLTRGDWQQANTHDNNYWLEFCDPLHRPGFVLHKYWVEWLNNRGACYAMSFWDWLRTRQQDPAVHADVNQTERSLNPRSATDRVLNVQYLDATERLHYAKKANAGLLSDSNDDPYDTVNERTAFSGPGWAIFVMDENNVLYAGSHIVGIFHHSSFLGGKPTRAAGELLCTAGRLSVITGKSGHYKPGQAEMLAVLRALIPLNVVSPDAVCKPSFVTPDWHNASAYLIGNGNAPRSTRDEVIRMIPPEARKLKKVLDALPPP